MSSVKICFLGTAAGAPTINRYTESVVATVGGNAYLLDGGEPCSATMIRKNIDYNQIKAIFISHMHIDHFGGIPLLIQAMVQLSKRKEELKLFIPEEAIGAVTNFLKAVYLSAERLPFKLYILPLSDNFSYHDDAISLTAHYNSHLKLVKGKSYSFVMRAGDKKIVYSGDIRELSELAALLTETDLLIIEMAHIKPFEKVFEFLSAMECKKIIVTHTEDNEKDLLEIAKKYYLKAKLTIAYDGMIEKIE